MISKNLYIQILIRVLLLLFVSMGLGWMIFKKDYYVLAIVPMLIILFQTFNLIHFLNKTNRRLFYFFDAIKNEDSTLSFPEKSGDKTILELNKSLNRVNHQVQQIKIENQQQEQYFRALMEHAATGLLTYDENGFVLHANSLVKKLFKLDVLTHLNQLQKIDQKLFVSVKNIQPSEQKLVTLSNSNGVIQLLMKATTFVSNKKELILISVQDIKNELDQKEIESWRKLIRVMMHEIMNSITPVTSLSESLAGYFYKKDKPISPQEIDEKTIDTTIRGLEVIKEQGKGLISFVESYRKLTRLPKPEKKTFAIKNLIENIIILSGSLPNAEKIDVSFEVKPEELEIFADEKQISQVLINLVKNAFQANTDNQNAKVRIVSLLTESGRPQIHVIDNGPGIAEDLLDKIFIPFFTTKEKGSGIGLSISRQIMQMHGGSLKIFSTPGKQTTAILNF